MAKIHPPADEILGAGSAKPKLGTINIPSKKEIAKTRASLNCLCSKATSTQCVMNQPVTKNDTATQGIQLSITLM